MIFIPHMNAINIQTVCEKVWLPNTIIILDAIFMLYSLFDYYTPSENEMALLYLSNPQCSYDQPSTARIKQLTHQQTGSNLIQCTFFVNL